MGSRRYDTVSPWVVAILLVLLCRAGIASAHGDAVGTGMTAARAGEERLVLPDLPVVRSDGLVGSLRDLVPDHMPMILAFSYTACESLCDYTHAILRGVDERLDNTHGEPISIVTLSIDPERDTPAALAAARATIGASDRWQWLTAGPKGTRAVLEALRFPAGAIEDHDPVFLVGRPCTRRLQRIVGLARPRDLIDYAVVSPRCDS